MLQYGKMNLVGMEKGLKNKFDYENFADHFDGI